MKGLIIIFLSVLVMSCGTNKTEKKTASVYTFEDWVPILIQEGDTSKYFDFERSNKDTLKSGDIFKAKLYMPINEYYDTLGQNIILKEQKMSFYIPGYNLDKFLTVKGDTGHIEIPIDSILSRIQIDSTEWRASIMPTTDSTYIISGQWYFKRNK